MQASLTPRYFAARDFFVGAGGSGGCWNILGVPEGIIGAAATGMAFGSC